MIVVDDHTLFRRGLAHLLDREESITVVSEASSGPGLVEQLQGHSVDVVILDVTMPDLDGIETIAHLAANYPEVKVLVLSEQGDRDTLFAAIAAGARGYMLKDTEPEELVQAIAALAEGGSIVSPSVMPQLLQGVREIGYDPARAERQRLHLSTREIEILSELATPKSPAQIAQSLFISVKTVRNHTSSIYRKLGVNSRMKAVTKATALRLIPR